jgi:hypothetical protein
MPETGPQGRGDVLGWGAVPCGAPGSATELCPTARGLPRSESAEGLPLTLVWGSSVCALVWVWLPPAPPADPGFDACSWL